MIQAYYYLAYAVRRLLGSDGETKNFAEWRAVMLLLLIEVQFLMALIYVFAKGLFRYGSPVGWGYGVGIPIVIATYVALANREQYAQFRRTFDSWSVHKRRLADIAVLVFAAIGLVAPILAKAIMG